MNRIERFENVTLYEGDCLEILPTLDAGSVDAVVTDPPYGTTACAWDSVIPLAPMWNELNRLVKPNAAIVLTATQPFTSTLISSNPKRFRYELVWQKQKGVNFLQANKMPLKCHENVVVFYGSQPTYNPQRRAGESYFRKEQPRRIGGGVAARPCKAAGVVKGGERQGRYPISVLKFSGEGMNAGNLHPTQKPVALMEYMIRTYTNEGESVLDFCCGSGTTGVACIRTGRRFVGIEKEPKYFDIACKRIESALNEQPLLKDTQ